MWSTNPGALESGPPGRCWPRRSLGVGFPLLKAPSRGGRKIMDQIEGFREYLSVAEEDRLNVLNPPEKTPELFERFLPYAIALDCQNAWAAKFASVLAAAGSGGGRDGLVCGEPRLEQRSGVLRQSPRQRSVLDHLVVVDRTRLQ